MRLHLIDGTYELFRGFYGPPPRTAPDGREVGATVGLLRSLIALLAEPEVTHVGCAFDQVIESFRNELYDGYKTGEGINPDLLAQFPLAERAASALGVVIWPMVEFEADDALATAARRFQDDPALHQVVICSPDKDLAQVVSGQRVVCWDRRREIVYDEAGVQAKYGVPPASIPDWLALVGDAADGIPGVPTWGAKSSAAVLSRYGRINHIPPMLEDWDVRVRGARRLHQNLGAHWEQALLYRRLTTLRLDVPITEGLDDLKWRGPGSNFAALCQELGVPDLPSRVDALLTTPKS
jgi:5'-3' exonuclease